MQDGYLMLPLPFVSAMGGYKDRDRGRHRDRDRNRARDKLLSKNSKG